MLDYDVEAARYDDTRGGVARAQAAADAIASLLPPVQVRTVLDVAGGTGLVASGLAEHGYAPVVCDRSAGMLALAAARCPGRTLRGDATRLPVASRRVDAVVVVWLLHLLASPAEVAAVVSEAARVLRPGGMLVSTVDKDAGHPPDTDVERLLASYGPTQGGAAPTDARRQVEGLARKAGLTLQSEGRFVGHGQGRVPAALADVLESSSRSRRYVEPHQRDALIRDLRALPDPDLARTPPTYRLLAWQKAA